MRRRPQYALALGVLALLICRGATGQEVKARAWVDSTNYLIGDWITVHVEIVHPGGTVFRPLVGDTLNEFHVIRRDPPQATADTFTVADLVLARYDSGRAILPPLPFQYSRIGDSVPRTVLTNPLVLSVHSLDVDISEDIKDIKPPLSVPLTVVEIALYSGILVAAGVFLYVLYRYWKKRQQKKTGVQYTPPARPAHVLALERLAILKEKKLWQQGLVKQYYSEVTEILRQYIENRYGLMALEQTTDEIMTGLAGLNLIPDALRDTELMLRRADLVKFAKHQPGIPEHEETMNIAYRVVDRTKAVEVTPELPMERRAVADVGT
jgi:hypothetical protein